MTVRFLYLSDSEVQGVPVEHGNPQPSDAGDPRYRRQVPRGAGTGTRSCVGQAYQGLFILFLVFTGDKCMQALTL